MQILKVEITGYISLSKSMSLRDELVENERAASDPLVRVIFRAKCSLGKNRENVSISRRKMTRTKGSDAARSFSTSSSRGDILLLSEM